jgi:hypothetical protein
MTFAEFRNALCILASIDEHELVEVGIRLSPGAWTDFAQNPWRYIVRADDATAERLWSLIEKRQTGGVS